MKPLKDERYKQSQPLKEMSANKTLRDVPTQPDVDLTKLILAPLEKKIKQEYEK